MRLKRLEIYGFKSFADRTVVEFDQGITGIVGPNGSGKSNLSDAVRWVLGEQSAKSLRGGKMEDVIFGGTDRRKRMGYCEVSLVFDNEDHALAIDFAEVMITRRVYRSGEGEYFINKSGCRLRDIIDLFRDTGIGRDGYSIIGQGRIDEILSQKSEDRRGVFEEAAGITKYRTRKEESERRLANMQDNLSRVEDIISELESQLEPLAKASETARRYLTLHDELRKLDCSVFVIKTDHNEVKIRDEQRLLEDLQAQIASQEEESASLSAERDEKNDQLLELENAVTHAHEAVLETTKEKEAREGELNVLRSEIAQLEKDVLGLTQEKDLKTQRIQELSSEMEQNHSNQQETQRQVATLEKNIAEAEKQTQADQEKTDQAEALLEEHKAAIIDSMNRLSTVKTSEARLCAMRQELERRSEEAEAQKTELEQDACELKRLYREAENDLANSQDNLARCEEKVRNTEKEVHDLEAKIAESQRSSEELNGQFRALESRLHVLQEMERDYSGYQQAVKQVLRHANGNPNVHGVVAGLIQVPQQYERAIESVLGGALQNIVTSDEYTARDMIAFLRSTNQGRATFLPISAIRGKGLTVQERQLLSMPGCHGVASELIGFDPRYQEIMSSLLGRTVIAEDLDSGIEIMKRGHHAFRLVTLSGDVIHSGGSMTGGSANSRMTSLLSRDREIKEHKNKIESVQNQIRETREDLMKTSQARSELRAEREQLFGQRNQLRIDVSIAEERLRTLDGKLQEQEKEERDSAILRRQIEENLAEIDRQLQGTRESQEGEEASGEEMNRKTAELTDDLYAKRQRLEAQRERVSQMRIELSALLRDAEAMVREAQRLMHEREKAGIELGTAQEQIGQATLMHQKKTEELVEGERFQKECTGRLETAGAHLKETMETRSKVQSAITAMTEKIDRLHESVTTASEKAHRTEMTLSRLQTDMEQIRKRIWEEYELTYAGAKDYMLDEFNLSEGEKRSTEIRQEIRAMGPINVAAVEDYRTTKERYDTLTGQRDDLISARKDLEEIIDELQKKMERQFMENFRLLQVYLSETFTRLFDGGRAELRLQDEHDVLGCGIDIVAQPPGKKLQMLSLLSGGERALTAIAILFAMLRLKPTPFCFLDEIEAALDDGNISTFADYLKDFSKETQFVIVTHRKGTMERCDSLYGVAMEEKGVSKMLSVELKDVSEEALA